MPKEPEDSSQPFDINEDTAEPSNRPEHDDAQRETGERLDDGETITPEDTTS